MIPYFAFKRTVDALFTSIGVTVVILIIFGYGKSAIVGNSRKDSIISACYTLLVGVVAAGTSYGIVRGLDAANPIRT
jgi:VIT1/CCC1 family predicted Fe2+/Mn2+ transporter